MGFGEYDFSLGSKANHKVPVELPPCFGCLTIESRFNDAIRNMFHIPRRYGTNHQKFIEGVAWESQFLEIGYLYLDSLIWRNIANFQVENIFIFRVNISIGSFFSFTDRILVLLFGILLFSNHSFDFDFSKSSGELVDAGLRIDREAILHLEKLIGWVVIALGESDVGDGIHNIEMIVGGSKGNKDELVGIFLCQRAVKCITSWFALKIVLVAIFKGKVQILLH